MIVTFYSYKGGVGRSFCLANIAVQLARWGNRVLCVDWDLEAPGLHEYFREYVREPAERGVVELALASAESGDVPWREAVVPVEIPDVEGLSLLAAGRMDEGYVRRAHSISWPELFEEHNLGWRFEKLREELDAAYDFVLLDSRTGITDIGGICTAQLPDVLVLCLAPNRQNLTGALDVARRAAAARDRLPYDKTGLLCLPVVSRFDGREEYKRADDWRQHIARECAELYRSWLPKDVTPLDMIERTTVPYLPYWSFGDEIAAVSERSGNPETVSYYMDSLASLLVHRLCDADVLVTSRDSYVTAAREQSRRATAGGFAFDVQIIGKPGRANDVRQELERFGVRVTADRDLTSARHLVLVDADVGTAMAQQIADLWQQSTDVRRLLISVVRDYGELPRIPSALQVVVDPDRSSARVAVDLVLAMAGATAEDGPRVRARWADVLSAAGWWLLDADEPGRARDCADRAHGLSDTAAEPMRLRAAADVRLGRADAAVESLTAVLSLVRPGTVDAAHARYLMGLVRLQRGEVEQALDELAVAATAASDELRVHIHRATAEALIAANRPGEAVDHLRSALMIDEGPGNERAEAALKLASLLAEHGYQAEAAQRLELAATVDEMSPASRVAVLQQLANIALLQGRENEAETRLRQAIRAAVVSAEFAAAVDLVIILVDLLQRQRNAGEARRVLTEVRGVLENSGYRLGEARLLEEAGHLDLISGSPDDAKMAFLDALNAYVHHDDRLGEARALINICVAERRSKGGGDWRKPAARARWLLGTLRGPEADYLRRQLDSLDPK
jgi:MinD-like ATPase involved in chromosome partitioning or flagellar assembly/tetratricopeptide (TPR) repeat protein